MKKTLCLFCLVFSVLFSGCGLYSKTYIEIEEYVPEAKKDYVYDARISVDSPDRLSRAVVSFIEKEEAAGAVVFSSNYAGDPAADLSAVCKQLITRNPLCAYCIENIDYEIFRVLTTTEATVKIKYAENAVPISDVKRLAYSGELKNSLKRMLSDGVSKAAFLINHSDLSDTEIKDLILNLYYESPLCAPYEPTVNVSMFSDNAYQRLYEINVDYHVTEDAYIQFISDLEDYSFDFPNFDKEGELYSVIKAAAYILNHCEVSGSSVDNTAYSALFKGKASSKGLSLAMTALCKEQGIECRLVYGQKAWRNHYWNLVRVDDNWYHIDIEECITNGVQTGFLLDDDGMWKNYRWNLSEYPQCSESITYSMSYFTNAQNYYHFDVLQS